MRIGSGPASSIVLFTVGGRLGDGSDELEELGCADDRVGNPRSLDQVLLGHLRAEVPAGKKTTGADDRQRNVMPHASGRLGGKEVTPRRLEELQDGLVLERRRVGHVDDNLSAGKRFRQSLTSDGVDAGAGDEATTSWPC
jgi:hypothetical protein